MDWKINLLLNLMGTRFIDVCLMTGDDLYPTNDGLQIADAGEHSFENSGLNHNRMLYYTPTSCKISCNISDPFGHKQPLNLIDTIASKL